MIERRITIKNKLGLHARAASKLVQVSQGFGAAIELNNGGQRANGKSIMAVMMLQAGIGTELLIRADGEDEISAIESIAALIDNRFGEEA